MIPLRQVLGQVLWERLGQRRRPVAVLLSDGIDSLSVCLTLLDLGIRPHCYSFSLSGYESTDFLGARRKAEALGLAFSRVDLPIDVPTVLTQMRYLARIGARKKTDFECAWPVVIACDEIQEDVIVTGAAADGHFCISKKGMIHYRDKIDEFRKIVFSNSGYCQLPILECHCKRVGKYMIVPYLSREVFRCFQGTSWEEINRPHQKQTILDNFPEALAFPVSRHTNLQLGDSGIAITLFRILLSTGLRPKAKSATAIYNTIVRENSGILSEEYGR